MPTRSATRWRGGPITSTRWGAGRRPTSSRCGGERQYQPQPIPTNDQARKAADYLLGLTRDLVLTLKTVLHSDAPQRSKWIDELWVWGQYLEKIGAGYGVANPPLQLAIALDELSDGVVDPLLSPSMKVKDDPARIWRGRTWAALGMECLLKKGLTRKAASDEAVTKWPGLKHLLHGPRSEL